MSKQRMKEGYIITYEWRNSENMIGTRQSWWESEYTFRSKLEDAKKFYDYISTAKYNLFYNKSVDAYRNIKIYEVKEITFEDRD